MLGPIFAAQGWKDSPFNLYPTGRYMWRDLTRVCGQMGLPFQRPSVFPRHSMLAARVALIANDRGCCSTLSRAIYQANFAKNRDISSREVIESLLTTMGMDTKQILSEALSVENKLRLREQTERAATLSIFGAPTFLVGDELFWGNDRVEQSIAWARRLKEQS